MIVAHPDDEILWGGSHLIDDKYLVVCVTCGTNPIRTHEFVNTMDNTDDAYVMLGYPDKVNGVRCNWKDEKGKIIHDLEKIMKIKKWDSIATHNPKGEYGHIHHILVNKMVTKIYNEQLEPQTPLYYFGKYYTKTYIRQNHPQDREISKNNYALKTKILNDYRSQAFINNTFDQMFKYENWINSKDWSQNEETAKTRLY
jgi:LmbE family N-acetylglucosaminyl deacetylase